METLEVRSKEEVVRDIEASRKGTKVALKETKVAWVDENPALLAWKRATLRAKYTKDRAVDKAKLADCKVRNRIYMWLGIAAVAGTVIGFWKGSSRKRNVC